MHIAVIGAGNGGAATAVELTLAGHSVALYGRTEAAVAPFRERGIGYAGVFGTGRVRTVAATTDLSHAVAGADAAVVALPTFALAGIARALHAASWNPGLPVILNPGHTGGAFAFETAYRAVAPRVPPTVEFSTLAYVARKPDADAVSITGRARALRAAGLPGGQEALDLACRLFPGAYDTGDVIACDLSNVNLVVHPPGAMLAAAWVEATGGDFTFYVEGMSPAVLNVMRALDAERIAVARAYGHELPTVIDEMKAIGTVPQEADGEDYGAIAAGEANRRIKAPDSLAHRYYVEDFGHGIVPLLVYAEIAGVAAPVASALGALEQVASASIPGRPAPRDAAAMGFLEMTMEEVMRRARGL
ncbi:NAD/NADP octopine/nopaline dehydrogenase family protein [Faunimonas sp. B44]|uniref:NAD/NADP octopine/nopaline dehydrogenase family protein n=1 Tax=Faunimonas sp. B44 TaxID=3461493 RepID=UPI004043BD50